MSGRQYFSNTLMNISKELKKYIIIFTQNSDVTDSKVFKSSSQMLRKLKVIIRFNQLTETYHFKFQYLSYLLEMAYFATTVVGKTDVLFVKKNIGVGRHWFPPRVFSKRIFTIKNVFCRTVWALIITIDIAVLGALNFNHSVFRLH